MSNDPLIHRPRRRRWIVMLTAGLTALGLILVGYGVAAPQGAPPAPSAAPVSEPIRAMPSELASTPLRVGLPESAPTSLRIPAIKVASVVNSVGLNPDETMEVPAPGPLYDQAAWYRSSPTPGELGPSVIIGHVDSAANGPSVFYELGALKVGDRIEATRADGAVVEFAVDTVRSFPKDAFPQQTVYGNTPGPELRLITCGGPFDASAGSYRNNTVVFARQIS
ncbi:class F sortase [Pseudonocardia sp. KRD-291]|nr:class F sortase [Pseudonocardia sp. KRD291]